ncbi:proton phosphate symporter [Micractinium conductrix]|uniref:Proton phosphate symporter n=1 Tax=Micractinium conductrix TaxID=554055 RepID=A0A2P6V367_9CHLO|nr:proton phosphate symporter [Micractinium conductrix]|eukprot:PSC68539.1 proton phosphate symporter [Micractinium conductrix]
MAAGGPAGDASEDSLSPRKLNGGSDVALSPFGASIGGSQASSLLKATSTLGALDVEQLGSGLPELRGACSAAELQVIARLASADHNFARPHPPATRNLLLAFWRWWKACLLPGMGMFSEAYIIFAIGNVEPLFGVTAPACWECQPEEAACTCNQTTVDNVKNVEISGVILGMLSFGFVADVMGRKWGSRLTMLIMFVGACLLTGAYGPTDQAFLSVFCFSLFFYAVGVGGEYPLASSSAAERAEGDPELRKRRGEMVVLTFSQQGWGNFVNSLVILLLLAMVGATGDVTPYQAEVTWRVQFGVGAVICFCVMLYRWVYLEESEVWKAEHKGVQKELMAEHDKAAMAGRRSWREQWVVLKHYWPRLLMTSLGWAANDFAFYGNKLFQSKFIAIISPGASRYVQMQWTLLNSGVALTGYYFAAYTIDRQWMGRKRMQCMGFLMMFVLFLFCGVFYYQMLDHAIQVFQTLYFLSSFFNQFGPNCTSFLVAGEVYPTDVRAFYHGISAAWGKLGAIAATSVFSQVSETSTFYASAAAGIGGALLTWAFLPDTTGLDLSEIDRAHRFMLAGQWHHYHGPAVKPRHLSLYERWRGYGKHYDLRLDEQQRKLQDMAKEEEARDVQAALADAQGPAVHAKGSSLEAL